MRRSNVAVVGVGAVGVEMLRVLRQRWLFVGVVFDTGCGVNLQTAALTRGYSLPGTFNAGCATM